MYQSEWGRGLKSLAVSAEAGGVVAERFEIDIADLPALADGDKIEIGGLAAGHTVVDYHVDTDALDANGAAALDVNVGIMSGKLGEDDDTRAVGNEMFSASDVFNTAGVKRGSRSEAFRAGPGVYDRGIGIEVNTAPATQATSGVIALTVLSKQ